MKQSYVVEGMHCASCKSKVEKSASATPGVETANVNLTTNKLLLSGDFDFGELNKNINKLGYKLTDSIVSDKSLSKKFLISLIASIPFIVHMFFMLLDLIGIVHLHGSFLDGKPAHVVQLVLSAVVLFWGGSIFYISALRAARNFSTNMDTLVVLGASAAWIYSTGVVVFSSGDVYFEASVFLILFILGGKLLEAKAKTSAGNSIKSLFEFQAKEAIVLVDGKQKITPISQVKQGDILLIKPGSKIPVDGVVQKGSTSIDESMITGESVGVQKNIGDQVIGATINKSSTIEMKATNVGENTMFAKIIQLVEEAQGSTPPIQNLANKVSAVFVPIIIVLAIGSFTFWFFNEDLSFAVLVAASVLVVACPCALGLATPTAVVVSSGVGAKRGILVKEAATFEYVNDITMVLFDKTGTLTKGDLKVVDYKVFGDKTEIFNIVSAVEQMSQHPIADAVVSYIDSDVAVDVEDFESINGKGVKAFVNGQSVLIGNKSLVGIETKSNNFTQVFVSLNSKHVATFNLTDTVDSSSKQLVDYLHSQNIDMAIVSGDKKEVVDEVASQLGITKTYAQVLPKDKADVVTKLQENHKVMMVGDGINDAPALTIADLGVAMGSGTDVAIESGDIVLVKGDLGRLAELFVLSKRTYKIIKQNLFWAFGYNVVAIPLAMGLLYGKFGFLLSPIIASAAMSMSSVSVVTNSLRLKRVANRN